MLEYAMEIAKNSVGTMTCLLYTSKIDKSQ